MRTILLAFITLSGAASAGEKQVIYEEYKVSVHQLHVYVKDKDGKAVKDLKAEDFTVKLNGEAQTIQSIQHISLLHDVLEADADVLAANPIPENGRRLFLFLFDLRYNSRRGLYFARDAARSFIENDMMPTDLAAIFTLGNGLNMAMNFTSDTEQLLFAVKTLGFAGKNTYFNNRSGYAPPGLIQSWSKNRFNQDEEITLNDLEGVLGGEFRDIFKAASEAEQRRNTNKGIYYLSTFKALGESLQVLKGSKNILFFSEGLDEKSIIGPNSSAWNLRLMNELIDSLQGGGTVVYAVDTSRQDLSSFKSGMTMLNNISASSGGRVYSNYNKYKAPLQKVEAHTSNYYLVNIQTDLQLPKGELAKVKVDVNRKGLKVYATKGLLVNPDLKSTSDLQRKLLLSEFVAKDQIALPIPIQTRVVQAPGPGYGGRLNILAEIQHDYFSGSPGKEEELEVYTIAVERETRRLAAEKWQDLKLSPKATGAQANIRYFASLELDPGQYLVKTIVRNLENGHTACMIDDVDLTDRNVVVSSPVQMDQERAVLFRPQSRNLEPAYMLDGKVWSPTASQEVALDKPASFLYTIDPKRLEGREHAVEVAAMVVDEKGKMKLAPVEAIRSEIHLPEKSGDGATLNLMIDMSSFTLEKDATYQLLTRINIGDLEPVRARFDFRAR